jgi:hypothetical protein
MNLFHANSREPDAVIDEKTYKMRTSWNALGFKIRPGERPAMYQKYHVPGYRTVIRERHFFTIDQVVPKAGRVGSRSIPGILLD